MTEELLGNMVKDITGGETKLAIKDRHMDINSEQDIEMLEKTLKENGCQDIKYESENQLSCFMEHYIAVFYRENKDEPFKVTLACPNTYDLAEKVTELTSEYTMNAQEATYFKIKEKINEKNYSIESEEVYEDNTIVLTININ